MRRVGRVALHVSSTMTAGHTVETEIEVQAGTHASDVRIQLAVRCPKSYDANARGFPLLAMSAGPDSTEHPGWLLLEKSKGTYSFDIDGNRYIDFNCGFGPHILGFNPDLIVDAVKAELDHGAGMQQSYWFTRHLQSRLAAVLVDASPAIEKVLFVNTGTEATMNAMRAGRAFTGKPLVGVFKGYYHGSHDSALAGGRAGDTPAGVPQATLDSMLVLPYNSDAAFESIRAHAHELALVMVEAVQGSNPQRGSAMAGWLHALQAVCRECDVLLAFDETVCGFRLAYGGGHRYFDIIPDLCTFGKIIGHGMPIGALCGRADILSGYGSSPEQSPEVFGSVGTFNGNPLSMAAGLACLQYLERHRDNFYPTMRAALSRLVSDVNQFIHERQLECTMLSSDDRAHIYFQTTEVRSAADVDGAHDARCWRELSLQLLSRGVLVGRGFLWNEAMTDANIDEVAQAVKDGLLALHLDGMV